MKIIKKKEQEQDGTSAAYDIEFNNEPATYKRGKVNSLAMVRAITGGCVLFVHTQFCHSFSDDCVLFFKELLTTIKKEDKEEGYIIFGDNENIYQEIHELFKQP